jgi:NAD(P)-dependent dehydrogenase (short-subunit alcohol dehydrogenase family)
MGEYEMASSKIALVTGGNRGIGLEICRQLRESDITVILSARDSKKGQEATNQLQRDGHTVIFHPLDVIDPASISNTKNYIESEFGKLDVLINNAAIFIDKDHLSLNVDPEVMRKTLETNLIGPLILCQTFVPIMKQNNYGRIVNISSGAGQMADLEGGNPSYRISKTALNALTKIMADEVRDSNILINTMCPGWVRTDMGGQNAPRSVEQGADTAIWLATLPDNGPSGKFFRDRKKIPW